MFCKMLIIRLTLNLASNIAYETESITVVENSVGGFNMELLEKNIEMIARHTPSGTKENFVNFRLTICKNLTVFMEIRTEFIQFSDKHLENNNKTGFG